MRNAFPLGAGAILALTAAVLGQGPIPTPAPDWVLDHFGVDHATVQDLRMPHVRQPFEFQVWLGSELVTVHLAPHDIRSPSFQLLEDGPEGLKRLPTPAPVTWRGSVVGKPESVAAGMIVEGRLDGIVSLRTGDPIWSIQSLRNVDMTRPVTQHTVFATTNDVHDVTCGVDTIGTPGDPGPPVGLDQIQVAEIAIDCDLEYYQRNGSSTTATQASVNNIVNGMAAIYRRDVEIDYSITAIVVRTQRTYTTSNMNSLLGQFQNRWNSSHGNVQRDLAHLFTGKGSFSGVVGIAYLGVVCNRGSAYGVDKAFASLGTNVGLISHEVGHNWNAPHCDGQNPCNIMCSGLGGCSGNLGSFGNYSKNIIASFRNSRTCLSSQSQPPTIANLSPDKGHAFAGGRVTITGTNLDTVTSVAFGSQVVNSGLATSPTSVVLYPPRPTTLATVPVSVTNPAGTSNQLNYTYEATSPAVLLSPIFGFANANLDFSFGGDPSDSWFLLVSINDSSTFPYTGFDVLANNLVMSQGTLDQIGVGSFQFAVPNVSLTGMMMYSQLIGVDETTGQINDITPVNTTRFF